MNTQEEPLSEVIYVRAQPSMAKAMNDLAVRNDRTLAQEARRAFRRYLEQEGAA